MQHSNDGSNPHINPKSTENVVLYGTVFEWCRFKSHRYALFSLAIVNFVMHVVDYILFVRILFVIGILFCISVNPIDHNHHPIRHGRLRALGLSALQFIMCSSQATCVDCRVIRFTLPTTAPPGALVKWCCTGVKQYGKMHALHFCNVVSSRVLSQTYTHYSVKMLMLFGCVRAVSTTTAPFCIVCIIRTPYTSRKCEPTQMWNFKLRIL